MITELTETYTRVQLSQLIASPLNPRKHFDTGSLAELAASIQQKGVILPLLTRPAGVGDLYEVVDGERRFRAARLAGVDDVPVIIRALSDSDVLEIAIVSAIQRQDLTPLEEAQGYRDLIDSNPSRYSAAYIADRIGRAEKYVWDRMKLLDLIPEAKQLLSDNRILVGHGELLARLRDDDQVRALEDGLFTTDESRLVFEDDTRGDLGDEHAGMKAVSVKELAAWIAKHVRFDVQHFAEAAPLDFGPVADRVLEASAKPGRGKKVVSITHDFHLDPAVKSEDRTFGPRSWKRADGREQSDVCDHAVLGVVAVGREYGQAFDVCIARDKCDIHWKEERRAKERSAKGESAGGAKGADTRDTWQEQQRKDEERRRRAEEAYQAVYPLACAAVEKKLTGKLDRRVFELLYDGKNAAQVPPSQFALMLVRQELHRCERSWMGDRLAKIATLFGVDIKKLVAAPAKPAPKAKAVKTARKAKRK